MNLSLEITENEYLIKLNKQQFDISFIRNLLKMVEFTQPEITAEKLANQSADAAFDFREGYFGHLDEK